MTWFDGVLVLLILSVAFWEMRQDAGRALLDAIATIVAIQLTAHYAAPFAARLGLPLTGGEAPPHFVLCFFLGLLVAGLLLSYLGHRKTQWTLEQYDPVFGLAFGLVMAAGLAHVVAGVGARLGASGHPPQPPAYVRNSLLAEEFRSFRTYHAVLHVLNEAREARQ
jgi:uncharacterized membrane protein required for colicin V production